MSKRGDKDKRPSQEIYRPGVRKEKTSLGNFDFTSASTTPESSKTTSNDGDVHEKLSRRNPGAPSRRNREYVDDGSKQATRKDELPAARGPRRNKEIDTTNRENLSDERMQQSSRHRDANFYGRAGNRNQNRNFYDSTSTVDNDFAHPGQRKQAEVNVAPRRTNPRQNMTGRRHSDDFQGQPLQSLLDLKFDGIPSSDGSGEKKDSARKTPKVKLNRSGSEMLPQESVVEESGREKTSERKSKRRRSRVGPLPNNPSLQNPVLSDRRASDADNGVHTTTTVVTSRKVSSPRESEDWRQEYARYAGRNKGHLAKSESVDNTSSATGSKRENTLPDLLLHTPERLNWSEEMDKYDDEQNAKKQQQTRASSASPPAPARGARGVLQLPPSTSTATVPDKQYRRRGGRNAGAGSSEYGGRSVPPRFQQGKGAPQSQHTKLYDDGDGESSHKRAPASFNLQMQSSTHTETHADDTKMLRLIAEYDNRILRTLESPYPSLENLLLLRQEFQELLARLIVNNLEFSQQRQLEQQLWKSCFYQIIEFYRRSDPSFTDELQKFISNAVNFYQSLLDNFQGRYRFQLKDYLYKSEDETLTMPLEYRASARSRTVKLALLSCQKSYLALGDLCRYREQMNAHANYGLARSFYLKAMHIAPKSGRPYNQLALLATYTHRRLDAVYYCCRSLASKNPFQTAHQVLLQAFEDVQKKVGQLERDFQNEISSIKREQQAKHTPRTEERWRREIWIQPDGSRDTELGSEQPDQAVPTVTHILQRLSTIELHRYFTLYFLDIARMLYSKIGMENFDIMADRVIVQLRELLKRTESPLTAAQLVQCVTVALFCLHSQALSSTNTPDGYVSLQLQSAFQFCLSYVGLLLERFQDLLSDHSSTWLHAVPHEVHLVLPALSVFAQWMTAFSDVYRSLPDMGPVQNLSQPLSFWSTLARLCSALHARQDVLAQYKRVDASEERDSSDLNTQASGDQWVLPEAVLSAGFTDGLPSNPESYVFPQGVALDLASDQVRLKQLLEFGEYLDGLELGVFRFSSQSSCFVATERVADSRLSPRLTSRRRRRASDSINEEERDRGGSTNDEMSSEFASLHLHRQHEAEKQKLLAAESERVDVELEICPTNLVIDTNTFLDHLPLLERALASEKFTIFIPLVVWAELNGLANRQEEWVGQQAQQAIKYVRGMFDRECRKLKALTTQGNEVNSVSYQQEQSGARTTNDDRILSGCQAFCRLDDETRPVQQLKGQPVRFKRRLVLITDDRNLRVKAIAKHIPCRTLPSFVRWARL